MSQKETRDFEDATLEQRWQLISAVATGAVQRQSIGGSPQDIVIRLLESTPIEQRGKLANILVAASRSRQQILYSLTKKLGERFEVVDEFVTANVTAAIDLSFDERWLQLRDLIQGGDVEGDDVVARWGQIDHLLLSVPEGEHVRLFDSLVEADMLRVVIARGSRKTLGMLEAAAVGITPTQRLRWAVAAGGCAPVQLRRLLTELDEPGIAALLEHPEVLRAAVRHASVPEDYVAVISAWLRQVPPSVAALDFVAELDTVERPGASATVGVANLAAIVERMPPGSADELFTREVVPGWWRRHVVLEAQPVLRGPLLRHALRLQSADEIVAAVERVGGLHHASELIEILGALRAERDAAIGEAVVSRWLETGVFEALLDGVYWSYPADLSTFAELVYNVGFRERIRSRCEAQWDSVASVLPRGPTRAALEEVYRQSFDLEGSRVELERRIEGFVATTRRELEGVAVHGRMWRELETAAVVGGGTLTGRAMTEVVRVHHRETLEGPAWFGPQRRAIVDAMSEFVLEPEAVKLAVEVLTTPVPEVDPILRGYFAQLRVGGGISSGDLEHLTAGRALRRSERNVIVEAVALGWFDSRQTAQKAMQIAGGMEWDRRMEPITR